MPKLSGIGSKPAVPPSIDQQRSDLTREQNGLAAAYQVVKSNPSLAEALLELIEARNGTMSILDQAALLGQPASAAAPSAWTPKRPQSDDERAKLTARAATLEASVAKLQKALDQVQPEVTRAAQSMADLTAKRSAAANAGNTRAVSALDDEVAAATTHHTQLSAGAAVLQKEVEAQSRLASTLRQQGGERGRR